MEIPLFKIYSDKDDIEAVSEVIKRGKFWAGGETIDRFEEKIAQYIGRKYCVVFNSGTSALHAALIAYGIKEGDEVIVPSFTFISTANTPLFLNAKPVFADIEEETFGLDPEDVKRKITSKTKAIIPIHYSGCPCKIEELKKIAEENNILLIEDAAESFGAQIDGKKAGTFGDSAMFSFCQNKIIATGEGGAMVLDDKDIYEKLKLVRSHGRQEDPNYINSPEYLDHITLGYNFRMPDMVAALGLSQIKKADMLIKMRRKNAELYTEKLKGIKGISLLTPPDDYFHVYQMFTILVDDKRDKLMEELKNKGIMTRVYFYPAHISRFYRKFGYKEGDLKITEKVSDKVLSLPMYPELKEEEINYICEFIKEFFNN